MTFLEWKKEGPKCMFFTRAGFGAKVMIWAFRKGLREGPRGSPGCRFSILNFRSAPIRELRRKAVLRGAEGEGSRFEPLLPRPEHRRNRLPALRTREVRSDAAAPRKRDFSKILLSLRVTRAVHDLPEVEKGRPKMHLFPAGPCCFKSERVEVM